MKSFLYKFSSVHKISMNPLKMFENSLSRTAIFRSESSDRDTRGRTWLSRERVSRTRDGKKEKTAWIGRGERGKGNAALIICTRTSLLSCGGRTRPLQLWHSVLPSCFHSLRPPLEPGYSADRPPANPPRSFPVSPSSSLAHFSASIARARARNLPLSHWEF